MQRSAFFFCVLALFLVPLAAPSAARADGQVSARGFMGFGKRKEPHEQEFVLDIGLRADLMFGPPRHGTFRFGPIIEGRITDVASLEAGAGLGLLVPLPREFSIGLYGLGSYATRREAPDGLNGIGIATLGYRGYNYNSWYSYGLNLFFSGRKNITGDEIIEFSGGVEVDFQFITVIPYLAIKNALNKKDPHEE